VAFLRRIRPAAADRRFFEPGQPDVGLVKNLKKPAGECNSGLFSKNRPLFGVIRGLSIAPPRLPIETNAGFR
jgi:hypothetical protein